MVRSDAHIFEGMKRDLAPSRQEAKYLYDAFNIRFTQDNGDTMFSITNEKGPALVPLVEQKLDSCPFTTNGLEGDYVGHCNINDYIVLFTCSQSTDYIYLVYPNTDNPFYICIYKSIGNNRLGFSTDKKLETLGVYENKDIQKVYWVDGVHQPRMLKIFDISLSDKWSQYYYSVINNPATVFDFIPELMLEEEVEITRSEGGGLFAPGVIQYAFAYYDKYGRESNIFYTSLLHYISYPERGGAPDTTVGNVFTIEVKNIQGGLDFSTYDNLGYNPFEYLRVFSIHRTSIDATPSVKKVIDIPLKDVATVEGVRKVTIVDDGMIGETVDPTELLYIGGENIVANTLTQKDNTLFLGNYSIDRPSLTKKAFVKQTGEDDSQVAHSLGDTNSDTSSADTDPNNSLVVEDLNSIELKDTDSVDGYYYYVNQLSRLTPGFKNREHYRLGIQFQYKTGKWSEPIFIRDYTLSGTRPKYAGEDAPDIVDNNPSIDVSNGVFTLKTPKLIYTLKERDIAIARASEYKRVRGVVVLPEVTDRLILTQGILCPTVFNIKDRFNDAPFAQSSWFFRPFLNAELNGGPVADNSTNTVTGGVAEFRHFYPLSPDDSRNCEIQGNTTSEVLNQHPISIIQQNLDDIDSREFYVDQSILTMHSPDIEFDDRLQFLNYSEWKLQLVGYANFTSNVGDIDIQTETPANNGFNGFLHRTVGLVNSDIDYWKGAKRLIAGNLWEDGVIEVSGDADNKPKVVKENDEYVKRYYTIYPWHKEGSLNNDENRAGGETITAKLSKKKMSNVLFSSYNTFFSPNLEGSFSYPITNLQFFTSDQVTMTRIPFKGSDFISNSVSYYGNVDTMLAGNVNIKAADTLDGYPKTLDVTADDNSYSVNTDLSANIRMKYKSTNHLVFSLLHNSAPGVYMQVLPTFALRSSEGGEVHYTCLNSAGIPGDPEDFSHNEFFWKKNDTPVGDFSSRRIACRFIGDDDPIAVNYPATDSEAGYYCANKTIVESFLTSRSISVSPYDFILVKAQYGNVLCMVLDPGNRFGINISTRQYFLLGYDTGSSTEYIPLGDTSKPFYYIVNSSGETIDTRTLEQYKIAPQGESITAYVLVVDKESSFTEREYGVNQNFILLTRKIREGNNWVDSEPYYPENSYLFLGELTRDARATDFGGNPSNPEVLKSNQWIPAGEAIDLPSSGDLDVEFIQGDTFYQRYDCLKTYPFTLEDTNSIVEIGSFLCETRVNVDGRYDKNRGNTSNLVALPSNFNLLNPVYNQTDNFFNYRILDEDYYNLNNFEYSVTWTKTHWPNAEIDLWTNITLASTFDFDGSNGAINALENFKDNLIAFQDSAVSRLLYNERVQINTTDGVPIEIANSGKIQGKQTLFDQVGCTNKWSIAVTPSSLYFIDNISKQLWALANDLSPTDVSTSCSFRYWFKNMSSEEETTFYDFNKSDAYFLYPEISLLKSDLLSNSALSSFMSYKNTLVKAMCNVDDNFYSIVSDTSGNLNVYRMFAGEYNNFFGDYKPFYFTFISNSDVDLDKTFTNLEARVHFFRDSEELHNRIFDYIEVGSEDGSYQWTGRVPLTFSSVFPSNAKKKFRIWRVDIPRSLKYNFNNSTWEERTMQRIRDTWAKISLGVDTDLPDLRMEMHDLSVTYYV